MSNSKKYGAKQARKKKSFWAVFAVATIAIGILLGIIWISTGAKLEGFGRVVNRIACWGFILSVPTAAYAIFRFRIANALLELERQYNAAKNNISGENSKVAIRKALDLKRAEERLAGGHFSVLRETKDGATRWMLITITCAFVFAICFIVGIILLAPSMRYDAAKVLRTISKVILWLSVVGGVYAFIRTALKSRIDRTEVAVEDAYKESDLESDLEEAVERIEDKRRAENANKKPSQRKSEDELLATKKEKKRLKKEILKAHRSELLDGEAWSKNDIKEHKRFIKRLKAWDKRLSLGLKFLK